MPHEHVTVTLDADTVGRIEADLDPGQSVADRVREVVERRYGDDAGNRGDRDDYDPYVEFVDDCSM